MTDQDRDRQPNDDQPLSSDELIRRAKESLQGRPDDSAIEDIVGDLEGIDVDVPVEEEFPEPLPRMQTRSRQPQRPRRVTSSYDMDDDPFERDTGPARRAVIAAVIALMLIAVGAAMLFAAAEGM